MTSVPPDLLRFLTPPERAELDRLLTAPRPPWTPLPGPQSRALASKADVLLYGGAAGGGKTDLLLGAGLFHHRRSLILRREATQLKAIRDRARELVGGAARYRGAERSWHFADGRVLELGAVKDLGAERKFQGRPHDFLGFDEITHFAESQFRFLMGWLRTHEAGQRCRVICAGNPPTSAEGEWVIRYWAPWLDAGHPRPAAPGELRWFAMIDGVEREVEGPEPILHDFRQTTPQSRSFIPARIEDNPHLLATGYAATLDSLPEPLRSKMRLGDFAAARDDDPVQVIPSAWVDAASARWREDARPPHPPDAVGLDVARGGRDCSVATARFGPWFAPPLVIPGAETPDAATLLARLRPLLGPQTRVQVDVIGVGAAVFDLGRLQGLNLLAMHGAEASAARDRSGQLAFANARAAWWWGLREALDPERGEGLALPPDSRLKADLCAPRWRLSARGLVVESKAELIRRLGRSPDRGDSLVYAHAAPPGAALLDFYAQALGRR